MIKIILQSYPFIMVPHNKLSTQQGTSGTRVTIDIWVTQAKMY